MPKPGKSWRGRLAASGFVAALLWSAVAPAELKLFPMWEQKQCPTETFACYTFDQTKSILSIDLDLQLKLGELDSCLRSTDKLNEAIEKLGAAGGKDAEVIAGLKTRLSEKHKALETNTERMVKAESRSIWKYLPWFVGGTVALSAAAFVGGWYVGSR